MVARVVGEALLDQHFIGPGGLARDRKGRRAVADGADSGELLDRLAGKADISGERLRRLHVHGDVLVSVTGDLVTCVEDPGQQGGVVTGGHSEDEECGGGSDLVEEPEQRSGLALEGQPGGVPVLHADPPPHQLVPVLEVDAEQERLWHCWPTGCHRPRLDRSVSWSYQRKEVVRLSERLCGTLEVSGR